MGLDCVRSDRPHLRPPRPVVFHEDSSDLPFVQCAQFVVDSPPTGSNQSLPDARQTKTDITNLALSN